MKKETKNIMKDDKKILPILNRGPLNDAISDVENRIAKYGIEERGIIIDHVKARILSEGQKTKESDTMQRAIDNLPLGLGKLMKRTAKDFEEDD